MYNKLFGYILDSSIWLEPDSTRIVWITLIAAMDEDGFAHFSAIENLASRARVTLKEAEKAIHCLEGPDPNSSNPANEGRRIERVPGGWQILNAAEHRNRFTREIKREQTRVRVANWRASKKGVPHANVTSALPNATPVSDSTSVPVTIEEALKFGADQHPKYEKRFINAWFEHREAQDPPWTKSNGMSITARNWRADLTKWVMSNRRGDFQSTRGPDKDRERKADAVGSRKSKDQTEIPDEMRSYLIEIMGNDRDRVQKWKVIGDVPSAYIGSYFAHKKKKRSGNE